MVDMMGPRTVEDPQSDLTDIAQKSAISKAVLDGVRFQILKNAKQKKTLTSSETKPFTFVIDNPKEVMTGARAVVSISLLAHHERVTMETVENNGKREYVLRRFSASPNDNQSIKDYTCDDAALTRRLEEILRDAATEEPSQPPADISVGHVPVGDPEIYRNRYPGQK
jgi:hypothetical protein